MLSVQESVGLQKGGVLLTSEARNTVVKRQEDELAQAEAIVGKAEQAQIKAKRKALLTAVDTTRRDMVKMRAAQERLKKELCKDIRVKAKAQVKRLGIPVYIDSFGTPGEPLLGTSR